MLTMFQSQETICHSQETKPRLAQVKEEQFFHLLHVQLRTLLQMTAEKNLLTSTQWRVEKSQEVTSYREYFSIELK